jgi:hypothetical protein
LKNLFLPISIPKFQAKRRCSTFTQAQPVRELADVWKDNIKMQVLKQQVFQMGVLVSSLGKLKKDSFFDRILLFSGLFTGVFYFRFVGMEIAINRLGDKQEEMAARLNKLGDKQEEMAARLKHVEELVGNGKKDKTEEKGAAAGQG